MKTAFINGRVAITIRYWEQRGKVTEVGARIDVRRVDQVEGPNHRPGAAGATIAPVGGGGGIWRADLLVDLDNEVECFHYHPEFRDDDVGERFDDPVLADDPRSWVRSQLSNIGAILETGGAADLVDSMDLAEHERHIPLMLAAVDAALERNPVVAQKASH